MELLTWTDIEPGIYFLAACMPSFGPLFRRSWNSVIAPHVNGIWKSMRGTDDSHRGGGGLALYTIGGGRRDHKSSTFNDIHTTA